MTPCSQSRQGEARAERGLQSRVMGWKPEPNRNMLQSQSLHPEELPEGTKLHGASHGPVTGHTSVLSCTSHLSGLLARLQRKLREKLAAVAARSQVSWGGRSPREPQEAKGMEPSPGRARPQSWGRRRRREEESESRGVWGSQLFCTGQPGAPPALRLASQAMALSCFNFRLPLGTGVSLVWPRCFLNNKLRATTAEFWLSQATSLDLFCFLSLFYLSTRFVYTEQNSPFLQYRATCRERGSCKPDLSF